MRSPLLIVLPLNRRAFRGLCHARPRPNHDVRAMHHRRSPRLAHERSYLHFRLIRLDASYPRRDVLRSHNELLAKPPQVRLEYFLGRPHMLKLHTHIKDKIRIQSCSPPRISGSPTLQKTAFH